MGVAYFQTHIGSLGYFLDIVPWECGGEKINCHPQLHHNFSTFSNTTRRFLPEPLDTAPEPGRTQFGWRTKPART